MGAAEVARTALPESVEGASEVAALVNGVRVRIRGVRVADRPALAAFVEGFVPETLGLRSSWGPSSLSTLENRGDPERFPAREEFLMEDISAPSVRLVAHGGFARRRDGSPVAEASFFVDQTFQHTDAPALLVWHLSRVAQSEGIRYLEVLAVCLNNAMLAAVCSAGYPYQTRTVGGVVHVILDISGEPYPRPRRARAR